jgi:FdhD protein
MSEGGLRALRTERIDGSARTPCDATVVIEEPLEIRLDGEPLAVTMRTPGSDVELALGFLHGEGILGGLDDLASAAHCPDSENAIDVRSAPGAQLQRPSARAFFASSSCGICGKASIDSVRVRAPHLGADRTTVSAAVLRALPDALRRQQALFSATGALHAAGLFTPEGELVCAREDVGRHNAVDKVIGWALLRDRLPLRGHVLLLSGRCGFELAQKALVAQIPIVASISGPSSLAVDLARESGQTLAVFVRGERMNLCSEPGRIVLP